jgi:hypothetical protein
MINPFGPEVRKWTLMLERVEVQGVVSKAKHVNGSGQIVGDEFDIALDPNYRYLAVNHQSVPSLEPVTIHCETYNTGIVDPKLINRVVNGWSIPSKKVVANDAPFIVKDKPGDDKALRVGDHIRIYGVWVIESGHPEEQNERIINIYNPPSITPSITLLVGESWSELHPFDWQNITLAPQPQPNEQREETISLAVPLWEDILVEQNHFLSDLLDPSEKYSHTIYLDGSNFHENVTADAYIKAPDLPQGWHGEESLIAYTETLLPIGKNYKTTRLTKRINPRPDGILVNVRLRPTHLRKHGELYLADIDGPSHGEQVFQAQYNVWWLPRLLVSTSTKIIEWYHDDVRKVFVLDHDPVDIDIKLENRGPDPLHIEISPFLPESRFHIDSNIVDIPAHTTVILHVRFTLPDISELIVLGNEFSEYVQITSNDPAHPEIDTTLRVKIKDFKDLIDLNTLLYELPIVNIPPIPEDLGGE